MESYLKNLGKIAILGAGGYMGNFYVDALLKMGFGPGQILATDINPVHLDGVRSKYPNLGLIASTNGAALLKEPDCAIVVVNSPRHRDVIMECLNTGVKKIFVEKPLVYTPADLSYFESYDLRNLYISYLINFSPIVEELFEFMNDKDLTVLQARSLWGKNWCAVPRPMGGDAEEEAVHPLALILATVSLRHKIRAIVTHARFTYVPFVQEHLVEEAKKLDLGFPDHLNDSSLFDCVIEDEDERVINAFIMSSFNMYEQVRSVEFSLAPDDWSEFPEYKAKLEFDDSGKDILRVKEAETDLEVLRKESSGNKLVEQLESVLHAFAGGTPDTRLVGFEHASLLVRIIADGFVST